MCPVGKDGAFNMNPQQSRGRDAAMAAPTIAPPAAEDAMGGDTTITLTMKPDGTVTCDCGDGTGPMPYKSMGEALDSLQQQYSDQPDDTESGQGEDLTAGAGSGQGQE